jgi:hypothetical protein
MFTLNYSDKFFKHAQRNSLKFSSSDEPKQEVSEPFVNQVTISVAAGRRYALNKILMCSSTNRRMNKPGVSTSGFFMQQRESE